ncbi:MULTISPECIES: LysR family transcriptional regulator [Corynebacterium]|uniref:LysR family transcriptional regulator n=1 Tax=Corynebacterium TaxID=1716 RepID=UPI00124BEBA8|nr:MULTISPECIES: LysR family transcriptional regulator [Corynebacterium]
MELVISYVKGTAPGKWFARMRERTDISFRSFESYDALADVASGEATVALARLVDATPPASLDPYHVVILYEEQPGIAVPVDSELTLLDEIDAEDIAEEIITITAPDEQGVVDVAAVKQALDVVGANVGVARAPRPLLRSFNVKSCAHRDFRGGDPTKIAVIWKKEDDCEEIQEFIGITRGRTPRSTRQDSAAGEQKKRSAREKTRAKQQRRGQRPGAAAKRKGARRARKRR